MQQLNLDFPINPLAHRSAPHVDLTPSHRKPISYADNEPAATNATIYPTSATTKKSRADATRPRIITVTGKSYPSIRLVKKTRKMQKPEALNIRHSPKTWK